MNDQPTDDYAALKKQLLGRIAFAVVILAGLLASLAIFDRMNTPEAVPDQRASAPAVAVAVAPVPVPPAIDTIKSQQSRPDPLPAVIEEEAVPEGTNAQAPVPRPAQAEKPLTRPATSRHALMRAPEPATAPPLRGDTVRGIAPAPPARPLAQATEKPYALQIGVFNDVANAEELRAKLEMAGIKASIEARVHVGPFATRAEADAARVKLRELGMGEALLLSMKGRKTP